MSVNSADGYLPLDPNILAPFHTKHSCTAPCRIWLKAHELSPQQKGLDKPPVLNHVELFKIKSFTNRHGQEDDALG